MKTRTRWTKKSRRGCALPALLWVLFGAAACEAIVLNPQGEDPSAADMHNPAAAGPGNGSSDGLLGETPLDPDVSAPPSTPGVPGAPADPAAPASPGVDPGGGDVPGEPKPTEPEPEPGVPAGPPADATMDAGVNDAAAGDAAAAQILADAADGGS